MARTQAIALLIAAACRPAAAAATTLTTEGGYLYDVQDGRGGATATDGSIGSGSDGAYLRCYSLRVNGADYSAPAGEVRVEGRYVRMPAVPMPGSVEVSRTAYVPARGGEFVRYLDSVHNPTGATVTVSLGYVGSLGSGSSTVVWATSDRDLVVESEDLWFGTDDDDGRGTPTLGHVFAGDTGAVGPTSQVVARGGLSVTFSLTVPAGRTVALMIFGLQGPDRATVLAQLDALYRDLEGATADLGPAELALISNWSLAGAPRLQWAAEQAFEVDEGGELALAVTVVDREGDPVTTSWDLDGDGEFDDATGPSAVLSAVGLDGPTTARVGVRATDGTSASHLSTTIEVRNAPPRFVNEPPAHAAVGAEWSFDLSTTDPGGDEVLVTVEAVPEGMSLEGGVRLSWVPTIADVGEATVIVLAVDEDDDPAIEGDGETRLEHRITVAEGYPLDEPVILAPARGAVVTEARPTIRVEGPDDPNGGLALLFELARDNTFREPRSSGPIPAGGIVSDGVLFMPVEPDGTTSWSVDEGLDDGQWFVRVWASDRYGTGPRAVSHFWVEVSGTGGDGEPAEGGCACRASGATAGGGSALLLALALLRFGRRRGVAPRADPPDRPGFAS